jgi:hypothetical protein
MPRFHFHVQDGRDVPDPEGTELPDAEAARREAISAAGEMLRDLDGKLPIGAEWRMHVTDEAGHPVPTLRFSAEEHRP